VFREWVHTQPYPVFPKCGVHWSNFGACLAADSVWQLLDQLQPEPMAVPYWDTVTVTDHLSASDYDLGGMLNLVWPVEAGPMAYPDVKIKSDEHTCYPRLLTIADSFYWLWYTNAGFAKSGFRDSRFWEYCHTVHTSDGDPHELNKADIPEEILRSDIVLLLCSEANLYRFGFGFVEEVYARLPEIRRLYQVKIDAYREGIRSNKEYMQLIEDKARQRNISVDSMLTLDAIYLVHH
jgi:hypothetical protein